MPLPVPLGGFGGVLGYTLCILCYTFSLSIMGGRGWMRGMTGGTAGRQGIGMGVSGA